MVLHAHDDGAVEGRVSLAVPTPVEPVANGFAGRRWDGAYPAQLGPRSLGTDPVGVVAGDDEHLGGGVGAYAECCSQLRRDLGNQLGE